MTFRPFPDAADAMSASHAQRRATDQTRGFAWAWPFRSAGRPRDHGGQQSVSRQPVKQPSGSRRPGSRLVRSPQDASGAGGAATRAAALEMLQESTSGVRCAIHLAIIVERHPKYHWDAREEPAVDSVT